ncbi:hypothetical protein VPH35_066741 [Triticum aestivum]
MADAGAEAGEVLDGITMSTHAFDAHHHPTAESALASDTQHHPAAESALASDAHHHLAAESALASDAHHHPAAGSAMASDAHHRLATGNALPSDAQAQQHPATVTTTRPAQEPVPPKPDNHFLHLRGDDTAGSLLAAVVKRAEDAIADEYDARKCLGHVYIVLEPVGSARLTFDDDIVLYELCDLELNVEQISPQVISTTNTTLRTLNIHFT